MDILEALEAAGIEVQQNESDESEIRICCPFCIEEGESSNDEKFRLGINVATGVAHCFNCHKRSGGGDWIFREIERVLDTGEIESRQRERKVKESIKPKLPTGFTKFRDTTDKDHWFRKAYSYCRSRGITSTQIEEKAIGYTVTGKYAYRIIFPIYIRHKFRGFSSRAFIKSVEPKHLNSVGSKALYNYPKHPKKIAVISESAITALNIEHASKKLKMDSLGLLGHTLTDGQLKLLQPYKRIIGWLDPDKAGIEGIFKIAKRLPKDKIFEVVLPRGFVHEGANDADPDELKTKTIKKRLLHSVRFTDNLKMKLKNWSAFDE